MDDTFQQFTGQCPCLITDKKGRCLTCKDTGIINIPVTIIKLNPNFEVLELN